MKKIIHRYNWNDYNFMAARKIFEQGFGTAVHPLEDGSSITVLPDQRVFEDLRGQERATLECLENRSSSSVFRIKELATVYHVFDDNRACRVFEDFDQYQESPTLDQLLIQYEVPKITFSVDPQKNGSFLVKRNKAPRFVGYYTPEAINSTTGPSFLVEEWIDPEPDENKKQKLMHKLSIFLQKYIKD